MLKRILSQLHRYVFWALISAIFWAWIFTLVTDTTRDKKVVLYADVPALSDRSLAIELEKELPDGIKMVQIHAFSYAAFDTEAVNLADLYILTESEMDEYAEQLCVIPETGTRGILLHEPGGFSRLDAYCTYEAGERYFLCYNIRSVHLGAWNTSEDDAALVIAERILQMKSDRSHVVL